MDADETPEHGVLLELASGRELPMTTMIGERGGDGGVRSHGVRSRGTARVIESRTAVRARARERDDEREHRRSSRGR